MVNKLPGNLFIFLKENFLSNYYKRKSQFSFTYKLFMHVYKTGIMEALAIHIVTWENDRGVELTYDMVRL